ncbi:S41 family peptidase [Reichenbachiella carrageenanivorans]|uniref:S41 family peptidase n=1 Tax=Reichenbachiella carrageenanivorans TaxID=2979869 RepID=A0ABY6D289_9BACT|nr:S41 family peptidase [Reichenbachiella carrageenanivorans]UXX80243.1 S41 family peptidase [Reichenbachiella carrageenanivorans]
MAKNLEIFASLYGEVNTYYVDEVNPNKLIRTSINAMLEKLDPYTVYIPEDDIEDFRTNATGEYGGIGIQSNKIKEQHVVLNIYENSPASTAGIKIGDVITAVDGVRLGNLTDDQAGKLMKGQSGSDIQIEVIRNGNEKLSFTTTREKITIPNISYSTLMDESIGYLRLSEFTNDAADDVKKTVLDLKKQGAKELIIDLRENPGGLLNEAVDICNLFVTKGSKIVDTKGKIEAQSHSYTAKAEPLDLDIPIAVIINHNSASASEIVSGVIQDYDRGVIIGQKSYGKGLVQVSRKLSFNSQLKVTTAKYYIPSGRCIQALDYAHRTSDGSATKVADSLKTKFYTSNNRLVYDGGGIDPDILIKEPSPSSYTKNLAESNLIFDYATKYYYENDSIAAPQVFELTDAEYQDFINWMSTKTFKNPSQVENTLELLEEAATDDDVYHNLIAEIEGITASVEKIKSNGLITFKPEIKTLLEKHIILRYYYTSGVVEAALYKDQEIKEARKILSDSEAYITLLKG